MFNKSLEQQTERALGAFRGTVENLARINTEAEERALKIGEQIAKLQAEEENLWTLIQSNEATKTKIMELLNLEN